jgi:dUTP pyrophosphatase
MIELQYTGTAPTRAYPDDAGLDLYVHGDYTIQPGQTLDLDLGAAIKSDQGFWALLTARSSTMRNKGLIVAQGVIDSGYTGPLYATVYNITDKPIDVLDGDRVAQLIVMPNYTEMCTITRVEQLPDTGRGTNGFGSSGT